MSDRSQDPLLAAGPRPVQAPRGTGFACANWQIEAAYRMIQNNLDPAGAENPGTIPDRKSLSFAAASDISTWPNGEGNSFANSKSTVAHLMLLRMSRPALYAPMQPEYE